MKKSEEQHMESLIKKALYEVSELDQTPRQTTNDKRIEQLQNEIDSSHRNYLILLILLFLIASSCFTAIIFS